MRWFQPAPRSARFPWNILHVQKNKKRRHCHFVPKQQHAVIIRRPSVSAEIITTTVLLKKEKRKIRWKDTSGAARWPVARLLTALRAIYSILWNLKVKRMNKNTCDLGVISHRRAGSGHSPSSFVLGCFFEPGGQEPANSIINTTWIFGGVLVCSQDIPVANVLRFGDVRRCFYNLQCHKSECLRTTQWFTQLCLTHNNDKKWQKQSC